MFSRRPGARFNRGRIPPPLAGATPPLMSSLISSVPAILEVSADDGVVLDDDFFGVTAWLDRTPNFNNYNQLGADAALPIWSPNGGPNGRACVSGDGIGRFIPNVNWDPPAPGTTPLYMVGIWRLNAWVNSAHLWGGVTASRLALTCQTSTPNVMGRNPNASSLVAMPLAAWNFVEVYYSNSAADFVRVGASQPANVNFGNNDQVNHALFALSVATNFCDSSCAWRMVTAGLPTPTERDGLINASRAWYGSGSFGA